MCRYTDLKDGTLTMDDVFEMLHIIDYNNYAQAYVQNQKTDKQ